MLFYRFRPEDQKGCVRLKPRTAYDTLNVVGRSSPLQAANEFRIARGRTWFDVAQFDDSLNFAISRKMKDALAEHRVSGWDCFPIAVPNAPQEYFAFQTLGKAGPILNLEALNNYETDRTEFDESTWDGSDIFNLENTLVVACVPRVKEVLEQARIGNLEYFPL